MPAKPVKRKARSVKTVPGKTYKINIVSTNSLPVNINVLVYGESGAGKTFLCKTAPAPLIISAESGMLTLKNDNIPVILIKDRNDLNNVYDWLVNSKEAQSYESICIDSISEIAELLLKEEKTKAKDARQAYGAMADLMTDTIRGFRDLSKNVYFTAKTRKIIDDVTQAITYMPGVPGQALLNGLPYFFDEVFPLHVGKTKVKPGETPVTQRYLQTVADRKYIAKDRSGNLLPKEVPDLNTIFNKIKNGAKHA